MVYFLFPNHKLALYKSESLGVKILCVLNLHDNEAFTFT